MKLGGALFSDQPTSRWVKIGHPKNWILTHKGFQFFTLVIFDLSSKGFLDSLLSRTVESTFRAIPPSYCSLHRIVTRKLMEKLRFPQRWGQQFQPGVDGLGKSQRSWEVVCFCMVRCCMLRSQDDPTSRCYHMSTCSDSIPSPCPGVEKWHAQGPPGTPRDPQGPPGTPRDPQGPPGTPKWIQICQIILHKRVDLPRDVCWYWTPICIHIEGMVISQGRGIMYLGIFNRMVSFF